MELGVQEEGQHQADDHHDGVPGGAEEPDRLVQPAEQPRAQSVEHRLHPPGLLTFLQGLEPPSPVQSLKHHTSEGGKGRGGDSPSLAGG